MKVRRVKHLLILFFFFSFSTSVYALPAFPGAVGFGADTVGGRSGQIIKVDSLKTRDENGTTLLEALEDFSGPRIIVFEISGYIRLTEPIIIKNPYVTILGQTAPGDGIAVRGNSIIIATHDVIIRHLRVRVGDEGGLTSSRDGINISTSYASSDVYNVIVDHCSVSWGIDENVSTWISSDKNYKTHDVTVQNCIISEALNDSMHVDEGGHVTAPHSMGMLLGSRGAYNLSVHHNIVAHNRGRNIRFDGTLNTEFVNNVIYNWGDIPTEISSAKSTIHLIGNYYKNTDYSSQRDVKFQGSPASGSKFFISGNYIDPIKNRSLDNTKTRNPSDDQNAIILQQNNGDITDWYTSNPPYFKASSKIFTPRVSETNVHTAYQQVLNSTGVYPRDKVDARVVNDIKNRTGRVIDSQNDVGGWPAYTGSHPTRYDQDNDGIPDSWEQVHGGNLNPSSSAPSGYSWIEEYANNILSSTITITIPGDANGDNLTNGADYIVWLNHYNQNTQSGSSNGDFDNSGKVDNEDYIRVLPS
ncbi:polysaccharide lyase family 1 protein [Patescibacteria group bacterium]